MGAWHEGTWNQRFQLLGDTAEAVFEAVLPFGKAERLGLRRPTASMRALKPRLRHMPDYWCENGAVVEVMGCGKDGIVKLKLAKLEALEWWASSEQMIVLFVWNSSTRMWVAVPLEEVAEIAATCDTASFKEGKEYYVMPFATLLLAKGAVSGDVPKE